MLTEDKDLAENFELADAFARDMFNRNGDVGSAMLLFRRDDVAVLENFCVWRNVDEQAARFASARELLAREAGVTHYAVVAEVWVCEAPKDGAPAVLPSEAPDGIGFMQIVVVARDGCCLSRTYKIIRNENRKARLKRWRDSNGVTGGLTRLFPPVTPVTMH